jgi:hypothetical protein
MKQAFRGLFSGGAFRNNYLAAAIATALLLLSLCASAQIPTSPPHYDSSRALQPVNADGFNWTGSGSFGGMLRIPRDTIKLAYKDSGAVAYKNGSIYTFNGKNWQSANGGTATIVITDTSKGIDSITFAGYQMCWYPHDSIVPKCWNLNTFFDDARLSDDTANIEFLNNGTVIKTIPSGFKTFGLRWPLYIDSVKDIHVSKTYFDSLYVSNIKLIGTSLYKYYATGDSALIGTITSGSGGITDLTNDVSASGTGSVSATVTGLRNSALPSLAPGNLRYSGSAWVFDNLAYLTAEADPKRVVTAAFTGTGTKTLTLTLADASTVTGTFTDLGLTASDTAFLHNKTVASIAFSGTTSKTLTVTFRDGTTATGSFTDNDSGGTTSEQVLTATAAQTAFTFTSVPASYNDYIIFVNGSAWQSTTGYTTSGNIVTTTTGLAAGDIVTFRRIK